MLPNFVIIGAMKAGTSSLFYYLNPHPEIFLARSPRADSQPDLLSAAKELDFFIDQPSGRGNWKRGVAWYEQQFVGAGKARAVGEASPHYALYPSRRGVPERMASVVPDARLIYIVRDPVARMVSHYLERARRSYERRPPERALREDPFYLDGSRYAFQIEQYLRYFSAAQLLVVVSEHLRHDRVRTLEHVFEFLGVDPSWRSEIFETEYNPTSGKRAPRRLTSTLMSLPGWDRFVSAVPERLKATGRMISHAPLDRVQVTSSLREELHECLRDDVGQLRSYVQGEFDGWGIA